MMSSILKIEIRYRSSASLVLRKPTPANDVILRLRCTTQIGERRCLITSVLVSLCPICVCSQASKRAIQLLSNFDDMLQVYSCLSIALGFNKPSSLRFVRSLAFSRTGCQNRTSLENDIC
eukprot:m.293384 g.293384  ORF g.293384 m.293384 type:complete len:120 (+) comp21182_c0_seq1:622-981(+)